MNVFEDLIVELKEENLLERTVIDLDSRQSVHHADLHETIVPDKRYVTQESPESTSELTQASVETAYSFAIVNEEKRIDELEVTHTPDRKEPPVLKNQRNDKEFFKKRAVDEVSSLQVVEHVLTGVERERLKIVPVVFDDLNAKKALHAFVQISENVNSEEHAQAEFLLMQETETWCSALAGRDRNISVSNIRRFCENSRPALSSQALLALARFYRNLPYSEAVRGKFDFVITQLFSRSTQGERRHLLFGRDDMLGHIKTLYADWSSIPLYAADDDDSNILLTALSFEELAAEAENAGSFDELLKSDFFGRLRLFKESISELFFAPIVTAAAIECNIRIGNAYVNLIDLEHEKMDASSIVSKYGDLNDQTISDAAGRTLDLVDLLSEKAKDVEPVEEEAVKSKAEDESTAEPVAVKRPKAVKRGSSFVNRILANALSVNKWLLIAGLVLTAASVGIYVWANYLVSEQVSSVGVRKVDFDNSVFKDYIKTARVSGETLYAVMQPAWETMPKERQLEFLQKVYQSGPEKGFVNVTLINSHGKMAGFASPTRLEIVSP